MEDEILNLKVCLSKDDLNFIDQTLLLEELFLNTSEKEVRLFIESLENQFLKNRLLILFNNILSD